jgi:N-methylhydantoinase A
VEPLVPAARRIGVSERMGPGGRPLTALAPAAIARAVRAARRERPEALAVGLLHSYSNPAHERRLGQALEALRLPMTLSSSLCPEVREYERFATTVTNAYLMPRVSRYLEALAAGSDAGIEIVLSHGGAAPPALAAREPVRQLLSGPAAGLEAAARVARACGFERALTLDVGGTSTDCAFVEGASLPRRRAREVAGFPLLLPVLDVHTVGAGGGSIARVDAGGLLHVGPESAGADPGPACYGRGGPPTVTDAMVTLGRIPGTALAGGTFPIDRQRALEAMTLLGRLLGGRDATTAAEGVLAVAESRIEGALRRVSVEQGHDPRDAALVAFGGAGGLHACAVAEHLGCAAVLFPREAGVLSALGALGGASRRERSRTVLLDPGERAPLERAFRDLERAVRAEFPAGARVTIERWAEVRYRGQSHELPLRAGADLASRFHAEHQRRFGFATPESQVEVVTVEVRASLPDHWKEVEAAIRKEPTKGGSAQRGGGVARFVSPSNKTGPPPGPAGHNSRVFFAQRWHTVSLWNRESAPKSFERPAILLEQGATLWVAPGWHATRHRSGTLVLTRRSAR